MKAPSHILGSLTLATALLIGCGNPPKTATDTPTSGTIHITVDDAYKPMIEAEIEMFESLYPKAKINATYASEMEAVKSFLDNESRVIVISRKLDEAESNHFKQQKVTIRETHIANDAIAFIVNPENAINKLTYAQVSDLFTGNIQSWKQLLPKTSLDSLKVIFDHEGSGNIRMVKETFKLEGNLPENVFAVKSNKQVIDYVESNKNAIGIISVNWISDSADSTALDFLSRIKVLEIGKEGVTDTADIFYKPYQGYIASLDYPLIRETYLISRESRSGLGTGFASFVGGDKGQRIILRSGMVPATRPVRIVNVNMQP